MHYSARGVEEVSRRREGEEFTVEWLGDQLRVYVDLHPDDENVVERLATWLARDDED